MQPIPGVGGQAGGTVRGGQGGMAVQVNPRDGHCCGFAVCRTLWFGSFVLGGQAIRTLGMQPFPGVGGQAGGQAGGTVLGGHGGRAVQVISRVGHCNGLAV